MKLQYSIVGIVLLVLVFGIVWLLDQSTAPQSVSVTPEEMGYLDRAEEIRYQAESGEVVTIKYADELARIGGGAYDQVVLRQVPAASGVKYEGEQGLTLWTKSDEVRIETPQAVVFVGLELTEEGVAIVAPADPVVATDATTTIDSIIDTTWFWQEAIIGTSTVTASSAEEFSVVFSNDNELIGDTDCNSFAGSYTTENNVISFGPLRSTLMFCAESQEELFRGLFISPLTVELASNDSLIVRNADGDTMQFKRGE